MAARSGAINNNLNFQNTMTSKRIAIFASGSGSNAENIINYFSGRNDVTFTKIYCNKEGAGVIERARRLGVGLRVFSRPDLYDNGRVIADLQADKVDLIVLAGFLWLVPEAMVAAFPNKIINIHPGPLPQFGGKGMYGDKVQQAILDQGYGFTGITIHYVNERYDEGEIILKKEIPVLNNDTPAAMMHRVHELEYEYFPKMVEKVLFG